MVDNDKFERAKVYIVNGGLYTSWEYTDDVSSGLRTIVFRNESCGTEISMNVSYAELGNIKLEDNFTTICVVDVDGNDVRITPLFPNDIKRVDIAEGLLRGGIVYG